eukprot:412820-Rhodomonas_salina.4
MPGALRCASVQPHYPVPRARPWEISLVPSDPVTVTSRRQLPSPSNFQACIALAQRRIYRIPGFSFVRTAPPRGGVQDRDSGFRARSGSAAGHGSTVVVHLQRRGSRAPTRRSGAGTRVPGGTRRYCLLPSGSARRLPQCRSARPASLNNKLQINHHWQIRDRTRTASPANPNSAEGPADQRPRLQAIVAAVMSKHASQTVTSWRLEFRTRSPHPNAEP